MPLCLTRRVGEIVRIGNNITVKVTSIKDGQVMLCFDAPEDITILREELAMRIEKGEPVKKTLLKRF